jgi:hypothetical protein
LGDAPTEIETLYLVFKQTIFAALPQIQRKKLVFCVALKSQNEFNVFQAFGKARVNGVHQRGEIKSGFRFLGPSPGGPEKRVAAHFANQQFF